MIGQPSHRVRKTHIVAGVYGVLGAIAVMLVPASAHGWFGLAEDPLAGVFAVVLGAPWVWLLPATDDAPLQLAMAAGAIGLNVVVILLVGRAIRSLRRR